MKINLRKATPEDMQQVHALVFELATFEKEPHEVTTTPEIYLNDCFTEKRIDILVAEDMHITNENKIIGIALTYWAYSTWKGKYLWLDDLIVTEKYRGKGIGKLLFEATMQKALDENAALFKWQVLDWNEPAIQFYNKYDAIYQKDWLTFKMTIEMMQQFVEK
ncbi:MAG: GNAT family N-acetyltransferase [Fimbriimonadaceae bacterium]|nr:GNAT family N-acetyltransferase [Chitinophagales bacterium]